MIMKRIKVGAFICGLLILFLILQYDFQDDNSWESWNLPLAGKIIILDPGHGGPDPGANKGDNLEKDIALNISLQLRHYLQQQGALVIMTRETDVDLASSGTKGYSRRKVEDLKKRLKIINESEADFFASIHLNAIPSGRWRGAQTFYSSHFEESERGAKLIQDELRKDLENTDRKAKAINGIYILKHSKKPGVLVEVGFLSNHEENKLLKSEEYQQKIAESLYRGILRYFTNEKKQYE